MEIIYYGSPFLPWNKNNNNNNGNCDYLFHKSQKCEFIFHNSEFISYSQAFITVLKEKRIAKCKLRIWTSQFQFWILQFYNFYIYRKSDFSPPQNSCLYFAFDFSFLNTEFTSRNSVLCVCVRHGIQFLKSNWAFYITIQIFFLLTNVFISHYSDFSSNHCELPSRSSTSKACSSFLIFSNSEFVS